MDARVRELQAELTHAHQCSLADDAAAQLAASQQKEAAAKDQLQKAHEQVRRDNCAASCITISTVWQVACSQLASAELHIVRVHQGFRAEHKYQKTKALKTKTANLVCGGAGAGQSWPELADLHLCRLG